MSSGANAIANLPGTSEALASGVIALDVILRDAAGNIASNRWTPFSFLAAAGANQDSTVIKASAGTLGFVFLGNSINGIRYVKFYDKASAPTSADTPVLRFLVPGSSTGGGSNAPVAVGAAFANGIAFRITSGISDNDTTTVTANDVIVNVGYQ